MNDTPGYYFACVQKVQRLSVYMIRIVFGGDDLGRYVSIGAPDDSVALYFPNRGQSRPEPNVVLEVGVGTGNGVSPSKLPDRVRRFAPVSPEGYLWFAGEAGAARQIRKYVRFELAWNASQYDTVGYWRVNAERWLKSYANVQDEVLTVYQNALDDGRSLKEAAEAMDSELERIGL